jgi:hypothetical protein
MEKTIIENETIDHEDGVEYIKGLMPCPNWSCQSDKSLFMIETPYGKYQVACDECGCRAPLEFTFQDAINAHQEMSWRAYQT